MKKRQRSASTLLQDTLLAYVFILIICIAVAVISIEKVSSQNKNLFQANLDIYSAEIDNRLANIHYQLLNILVNTNSLSSVPNADIFLETAAIRTLKSSLTSLQNSDGHWFNFFFYRAADHLWVSSDNRYFSYKEWRDTLDSLSAMVENEDLRQLSLDHSWTLFPVGESLYILHCIEYNGFLAGTWIKAERLLSALLSFDQTKTAILLSEKGNKIYPLSQQYELDGTAQKSGLTSQNMTVTKRLQGADFQVQIIIDNHGVYAGAFLLQISLSVVSILLLASGLFLLLYTYRQVIRPLNHFSVCLEDYIAEKGIPNEENFFELQQVNRIFRSLLKQLENLKIKIYEEKLQRQQVEFEYFQAQIQPHFYLNCLNIIFNMATTGHVKEIGQFSILLSNYLRALFRGGMEPIPLKEELDVIDNYLAIQHIRYGGKYTYHISRQDGLEDIPIPPFIILTMVENSIKHNLTPDGGLDISLEIKRTEKEDESDLDITIDDSGGGFSPSALEQLNQGKRLQRQNGRGIGIWNTLQRIRIIYGGKASVHFSNNPLGGARVEIRIPLCPPAHKVRRESP
ncbi:MAG: histidine kinase [Oscillospiraceae bacterium]|nr:histidine kinase [Oscillospiraceae bacterium]